MKAKNTIVERLLEGSTRISASERQKANAALRAAGMDGNKKFATVGAGINATTSALSSCGIEPMEIFQTFGSSGRQTLRLGRMNMSDPFSTAEIPNTMLVFSWYQLGASGNYEVTAYVS